MANETTDNLDLLCAASNATFKVNMLKETKRVFPGWQRLLIIILDLGISPRQKVMSMGDIMRILVEICPHLSKKGPLGGRTVRNTVSNAITMAIKSGKVQVVGRDRIKGRYYSVTQL